MARPSRQPAFSPFYGHSSAVEFERNNQVPGISRRYRLTGGKSPVSPARLERWIDDLLHPAGEAVPARPFERLRAMADKVVGLNPELAAALPDPGEKAAQEALLRGVASQYNPHDIAYFMHRQAALSPGASKGANMRQVALETEIQDRMKIIAVALEGRNGVFYPPGPRWRPSPTTLDMIEMLATRPALVTRQQRKPPAGPI